MRQFKSRSNLKILRILLEGMVTVVSGQYSKRAMKFFHSRRLPLGQFAFAWVESRTRCQREELCSQGMFFWFPGGAGIWVAGRKVVAWMP